MTSTAIRDFSRSTFKALAARGIAIYGVTAIPGHGAMPYANASRGYKVNDNGCGRIWTFEQVMEAAK